MGMIAAVASATAFGTAIVVALGATEGTVVAGRATAAIAGAEVVLVDRVAAIGTTASRPLVKPDVGAARVVGLQDLGHEQEEVAEPALLQRRANRGLAVPFAQRLALDMRMRNVVMTVRHVRFKRNDVIHPRLIELIPMQHNSERAKVSVFQSDRIGHEGDRVLLQVAIELAELGLQGIEFIVHLA